MRLPGRRRNRRILLPLYCHLRLRPVGRLRIAAVRRRVRARFCAVACYSYVMDFLPRIPANPAPAAQLPDREEIEGLSLRNLDLCAEVREHLFVQESLFEGCRLAGSVFSHVHFSDVEFRRCDLSNADWRGCSFHRVLFSDCRLTGTDLAQMTATGFTAERCKAELAGFAASRLRSARFVQCGLSGCDFGDCRFERVEFSRCDLRRAEFFGTRLRGLSFADSQIEGIRVREVGSFELGGLEVNMTQAVELAQLLGVKVLN